MEVAKTNNQKELGATVLIYGECGLGKTTLWGTLPHKETLILDVEGGLRVLEKLDIDYITIKSDLSNLKEVFSSVMDINHKYKYICLDSVTELEKFMQITIAHNGGRNVPAMCDYKECGCKMFEYMFGLRDLREKGINVFISALEMPLELERLDDVVRTKLYPMLQPKTAPIACGLYDIVARIEKDPTDEKEERRLLRLNPTERMIAKNRLNDLKYCEADLMQLINPPKAEKGYRNNE